MHIQQKNGPERRHILRRSLGLGVAAILFLGLVRDSDGQTCKDDEWSEFPACSRQFAADRTACDSLPKQAKRRRHDCWVSQMDRLVTCNKSKGKVLGYPPLKL